MSFKWNGLVRNHPMPIGTMVNGQYNCTLWQVEVRPTLHPKQPELLEHGFILLQHSSTPFNHHDVLNLVQCWSWEVLAHLPTLHILPIVMTSCVHIWRNIFRVNSSNQKMISTLLSLNLYINWARMNTELQLIIYHVDGKSVWTVLAIILCRGHMCKHSGISVVLLSCILLLQ